MNGLRAFLRRLGDDLLAIEEGGDRGFAVDGDDAVGQGEGRRGEIGCVVQNQAAQAEGLDGAQDARGYFAAVGDQDRIEWPVWHYGERGCRPPMSRRTMDCAVPGTSSVAAAFTLRQVTCSMPP